MAVGRPLWSTEDGPYRRAPRGARERRDRAEHPRVATGVEGVAPRDRGRRAHVERVVGGEWGRADHPPATLGDGRRAARLRSPPRGERGGQEAERAPPSAA